MISYGIIPIFVRISNTILMAHITSLSLENFRVFKEKTHFDFAPLTILTGANNAGKSSVLKALLLLADNAQKNDFLELDFSGDQHHLDTFDYTVNKDSKSDEISISFDLSMLGEIEMDNSSFRGRDYESFYLPSNSNLNIEIVYKKEGNKGHLIGYSLFCQDVVILSVKYNLADGHSVYINFKWLVLNDYVGEHLFIKKDKVDDLFANLQEDERKEITTLLNKQIIDYISYTKFEEEEWYKLRVPKTPSHWSSSKTKYDQYWELHKESLIKNYKNKTADSYEMANYYNLIDLFFTF